jgi:hypothetical protein
MTGSAHTSPPAEMEGEPLWRQDVKHYAVERLLDWGFAPSAIARMLGCSKRWIATISEQRSSDPF